MAPKTHEAAKVHLITCFAEALRKSISANRSGEWLCAASTMTQDTAGSVLDPGALGMRVRLRGTIHGDLRVEVSSRELLALFPEPTVDAGGMSGAWGELIEGAIHQLPKRAVDAGVFPFSVDSHELVLSGGDGVQIGRIELMEADTMHVTLHVLANAELLESLQMVDGTNRGRARSPSKDLLVPELGRVIDVPLNVTLRFGQRTMRLCEVLELNTGAVVELDRQVEDPVDLILDERVIAKGEVVIVDGNYGLRVTEIVERHPTLVL